MFKDLIISMRIYQWYKNFLIFAGIIFSKNLFDLELLKLAIFGFIAFCLASSGHYIFNDILDREKDRKHPKKCKRPIASGKISLPVAAISSAIMILASLLVSFILNFWFFLTVVTYLILNLIYSTLLKKIILLDILTISVGFVIRAVAGCSLIDVLISPWLILCTFLLALFLALGKRRNELILLDEKAKEHRGVLGLYSTDALNQMLSVATSMTIISYSLYTFFAEQLTMMLTIPIVVYGMFRYLLLIYTKNFGGETEMVFRDLGLTLSITLWVVTVLVLLYLW
ncbi:MAG: decaprenyl-phosphate phosphoribosyltransferase [Nitrososphaerota archaeon]